MAGIAGIVLGSVAESLVNHVAGTTVVTDGMMWGAVLAILLASLPSFTRMGSLTAKSGNPAVDFVVGVGVFILISLVIMAAFFGLLWLIGRVLL